MSAHPPPPPHSPPTHTHTNTLINTYSHGHTDSDMYSCTQTDTHTRNHKHKLKRARSCAHANMHILKKNKKTCNIDLQLGKWSNNSNNPFFCYFLFFFFFRLPLHVCPQVVSVYINLSSLSRRTGIRVVTTSASETEGPCFEPLLGHA